MPRATSKDAHDCEQLTPRCILHKAVVGHDDRELCLLVCLSVMWIVRGSGSHATTAPVSEACVCELVRGLLRWIRTSWDALFSGFPFLLVRVVHQTHHSTTPNEVLIGTLSMSQLVA